MRCQAFFKNLKRGESKLVWGREDISTVKEGKKWVRKSRGRMLTGTGFAEVREVRPFTSPHQSQNPSQTYRKLGSGYGEGQDRFRRPVSRFCRS